MWIHSNKLVSLKGVGIYSFAFLLFNRTIEDTLSDFEGTKGLSVLGSKDSSRIGRIPMAKLETIINSVKNFHNKTV